MLAGFRRVPNCCGVSCGNSGFDARAAFAIPDGGQPAGGMHLETTAWYKRAAPPNRVRPRDRPRSIAAGAAIPNLMSGPWRCPECTILYYRCPSPRKWFAEARNNLSQWSQWSQWSPCLSSLNTEGTEHPSDLCVEALLATEVLLTGGEIFARSEETQP